MVAKGGVNYLTMCAAIDLAPFNISVNAVGSGLVERRSVTESTLTDPMITRGFPLVISVNLRM